MNATQGGSPGFRRTILRVLQVVNVLASSEKEQGLSLTRPVELYLAASLCTITSEFTLKRASNLDNSITPACLWTRTVSMKPERARDELAACRPRR